MTPKRLTAEEAEFVETALYAVDSGSAGHWPTVAGYLADEVRRLRAQVEAVDRLCRARDDDALIWVRDVAEALADRG